MYRYMLPYCHGIDIYLELQRGVQWRSLSGVGASIGDPFEGAGNGISEGERV